MSVQVSEVNKMKVIITLALLAISQARVIKTGCDLVSINNNNYEKEVLKDNLNDPYQMSIDYSTNTLFFSYGVSQPGKDFMFQSASFNLKTRKYNDIPGIIGGFATAVDNKKHKVYLGGRNGIYEYDYETKKATHVNPDGYSIWQLFFKDKLYYTAYPQERVYTFEGGKSEIVPELQRTMAQLVALDNDHNMYFSNSSGLFCLKKSDKKIIQLGEYTINSFTVDMTGNLYFSTPSGLYSVDNKQNVKNLAEIDGVLGMVVDLDNNIIYAISDKIIRLAPTTKQC